MKSECYWTFDLCCKSNTTELMPMPTPSSFFYIALGVPDPLHHIFVRVHLSDTIEAWNQPAS